MQTRFEINLSVSTTLNGIKRKCYESVFSEALIENAISVQKRKQTKSSA